MNGRDMASRGCDETSDNTDGSCTGTSYTSITYTVVIALTRFLFSQMQKMIRRVSRHGF